MVRPARVAGLVVGAGYQNRLMKALNDRSAHGAPILLESAAGRPENQGADYPDEYGRRTKRAFSAPSVMIPGNSPIATRHAARRV